MLVKNIALSVLAALFLASCVSYAPSIPDGYRGPVAEIRDSYHRIDGGKADLFYLYAIDGRRIHNSRTETRAASAGRGNSLVIRLKENEVQSGGRILTIVGRTAYAMPARAMTSKVYEVRGDVDVQLEENSYYVINGELKEEGSSVWIEDSQTGEVLAVVEVEGSAALSIFEK